MSKKVKFSMIALLLLLIIAEGVVRLLFAKQEYTAGSWAPNWFPQVEEGQVPMLEESYYTDSTGMFRASQPYWRERGVAINEHGFLGDAWPPRTSKPRLLLIGDSFVWGAGAEPISQSFANLLAAETDYEIINTGIPGADPAQYQLIAERFIPELEPDVVVVCVYLGNDVVSHVRQPQPFVPLYFPSDVGWFPGYFEGQYFGSLEESYQFYLKKYTPNTGFSRLVCKTALGTALYSLPLRLEEKKYREELLQSTVTNAHLKAIAKVCDNNGVPLHIAVIPYSGTDLGRPGGDRRPYIRTAYKNVLEGLDKHLVIMPLQYTHYHPLPDGHFNNAGHQLFAEKLKYLLSEE